MYLATRRSFSVLRRASAGRRIRAGTGSAIDSVFWSRRRAPPGLAVTVQDPWTRALSGSPVTDSQTTVLAAASTVYRQE